MEYHIVWLDSNINSVNEAYQNDIMQLKQVIDSVDVFTNLNGCIDFVNKLKNKKVFMIISKDLNAEIVQLIHNIPQIKSIYVFCDNHSDHQLWAEQYKKVKGVFTQIKNIYYSLNNEIRRNDECLITFSNISLDDTLPPGSNQLNQSFMYSQLLKDTFLKIEDEDRTKEMKELITFLRDEYANRNFELKLIADFEKNYDCNSSVKWYSKELFIYSTLNTALRTQDIDIIVKMGFFIRDLHRQIVQLQSSTTNIIPSTVYRGQRMLSTEFEKLKNSKGSLLSFNNFLSTSKDEAMPRALAESSSQVACMIGILFEIKIDPSNISSSFAAIDGISQFPDEEEILFSMNTVFRIDDMQFIDNRLWKVYLTLTSDTDEQLQRVIGSFRQELGVGTGQQQLAHLMMKLDKNDIAEKIYSELRKFTTTDNWKELALIYNQLGSIDVAKGSYETALSFFKKTADIEKQFLSANDPSLAVTYNNIAETYHSMKNFSTALDFHGKALRIYQEYHPQNYLLLAATHNNIAVVHKSMGNYQKARLMYQKAIEVAENDGIPNHPKLATIYENLASLHTLFYEYHEALSFYEKALEINKKTLPPNHTSLLITYNNMVSAYTSMGKYSDALLLFQQTLEVPLTQLDEDDPLSAVIYINIGLAYLEMGNDSEAWLYYQKALEIQKKNDPDNNLDMVTTYCNIGDFYRTKREFHQAFSFYHKAREIEEKCLPPTHPNLATTYNDLGDMCRELKNYEKAHEYFQNALNIRKECFGSDHSSLASVFNNIGACHQATNNYTCALSCYEKALKIYETPDSSNCQNLALTYNNIGHLRYLMKDYSTALEFFQKTLDIELRFLGSNHPDLAYTYNHIAYALEGQQRYEEAFIHLMKGIYIFNHHSNSDDCRLQILFDHLEIFVRECLSRL
ncbi:unnamed protein product [Adineta steineri]|uniref:ADP ribosyltransferase domain-containing protein n=1 Tax=Adineta steineri TaxID=433720 RepID=A0A813VNE7_9BILA|nr:unnamed protein product [Adineta steineri]CAF1650217.1 unnamed protein product [Adineta steineri]